MLLAMCQDRYSSRNSVLESNALRRYYRRLSQSTGRADALLESNRSVIAEM